MVTDIIPIGQWSPEELLRLAASAERVSEHPLGEAIVQAAEERGIETVAAHRLSRRYRAWRRKPRWMAVWCWSATRRSSSDCMGQGLDQLRDRGEALQAEGKTSVYVAVDGQPAGVIAIADTLKPHSR